MLLSIMTPSTKEGEVNTPTNFLSLIQSRSELIVRISIDLVTGDTIQSGFLTPDNSIW